MTGVERGEAIVISLTRHHLMTVRYMFVEIAFVRYRGEGVIGGVAHHTPLEDEIVNRAGGTFPCQNDTALVRTDGRAECCQLTSLVVIQVRSGQRYRV